MPELRECIAHFLCMLWFLQHCLEAKIDLCLLGLWADATDEEAKTLALDGMVYQLNADSKVKRGTCSAQTSLWPQMWKKLPSQPDPPSIQTLHWKKVILSSRAIILDLGELYLQVSRFRLIT